MTGVNAFLQHLKTLLGFSDKSIPSEKLVEDDDTRKKPKCANTLFDEKCYFAKFCNKQHKTLFLALLVQIETVLRKRSTYNWTAILGFSDAFHIYLEVTAFLVYFSKEF